MNKDWGVGVDQIYCKIWGQN